MDKRCGNCAEWGGVLGEMYGMRYAQCENRKSPAFAQNRFEGYVCPAFTPKESADG